MGSTDNLPEFEVLILKLIEPGLSSAMLSEAIAMQAAKLSCTELDAALVKLQICGASQQLETQAGYLGRHATLKTSSSKISTQNCSANTQLR